jgi:shikimate kinase
MKRELNTGMSATGKSAVVRELAARGYRAVDLDTPEWSEWVDADPPDVLTPRDGKDWVWREGRVRTLLSEHQSGTLFISGCAENMNRFSPLIGQIVLLSAPMEVIMKRLETRSPSGYDNPREERQKVSELIATIEPLLRDCADHEIDTIAQSTRRSTRSSGVLRSHG